MMHLSLRIDPNFKWLEKFHQWKKQQDIAKERRSIVKTLRISESSAESISILSRLSEESENDLINDAITMLILYRRHEAEKYLKES